MKKSLLVISGVAAVCLLAGCRGRLTPSSSNVSSNSDVTPSNSSNSNSNQNSNSGNSNSNNSNSGNSHSTSSTISSASGMTPRAKADTTILIYMCGSDLESGNGLATSDIDEILSISGQPSDVNIVIQCGGAKVNNTYFSKTQINRFHVENKNMVKDISFAKTSMGLSSTLQSFIEYGLTYFPASKESLIIWNHGNGMVGCCFDELSSNPHGDGYSEDHLLNSEVKSALSGAFKNLNRTEKLEWIGYDCCLMQMQDVAETNSTYAKYMVGSQESEAGEGWDYDTWVDDLYSKKTTETILKAIVDGFIEDNGGPNISTYTYQGQSYTADQTLSYLDLSSASEYKTAWENMATQLQSKIKSFNKSSWNSLVDSAKHFAGEDYAQVGCFDAKDFVNKLSSNSTFKPDSTYTNAVLTAFGKLVKYNVAQKGAGNAYGLSMYYDIESSASRNISYSADQTNFSAWRTIVDTYAGESSGGGGWGWY